MTFHKKFRSFFHNLQVHKSTLKRLNSPIQIATFSSAITFPHQSFLVVVGVKFYPTQ